MSRTHSRALPELGLGIQVALASRITRLRTVLTAGGVALGVIVLALAASVPHAYSARKAREHASTPVFHGGSGRLRLLSGSTSFRGVTIGENAVQVTGASADGPVPLPPGVRQLPGPGEMVVSGEVLALLRGPHGAELRRRLDARVVGTIGDAGLSEPHDAVIYRGSTALTALGEPTVGRFGGRGSPSPTPVLITLLVIMIVVALLLPVAVFVATAARFGAEERDRRLAAMRLVGADRVTTARVAAGESLFGAVVGLIIGAAGFLAVRVPVAHINVAGIDVFPADLRPSLTFAVLVALLVPLSAVAATLISIRRVAIEPLGVTRRGTETRRRLGWRLVAPVIGFVLLAPLLGSSDRLAGAFGQAEATAGVVLVLVGVTALLPWVVEATVRRAPDGPLPWLLAIRRLRGEEGTTGRVVGAIGLAVAGAIALSIVFSAAQSDVRVRVTPLQARLLIVDMSASTPAGARRELGALRGVPGVARVSGETEHLRRATVVDATVVMRSAGDQGAVAAVRDRAAALDPLAQVMPMVGGGSEAHTLSDLRRVLFAGAVIVLLMIGASLLVAAGEGLRERRRALAVLAAFGTRRSTVAWSMFWQAAIPVVGGLLLAVGLGIALGAMLSAVVSLSPQFDWGAIGLMLGAGVAVIAAVTGLTLPTVTRMMRPEALRVE
ncbi:MAG TPA: FtsX-like permease family protein [Solirubrobacteraceae bacterium]|nr:FtsX-like permease family protein [Solirubrobacteraceae bacterium]